MSECDIVNSAAGGKEFKYCRTHKVEPLDCPAAETSSTKKLWSDITYIGKTSSPIYIPHSWVVNATSFSCICKDCGITQDDYITYISKYADPGCSNAISATNPPPSTLLAAYPCMHPGTFQQYGGKKFCINCKLELKS